MILVECSPLLRRGGMSGFCTRWSPGSSTSTRNTYDQVAAAIDKLAEDGPGLGRPLADWIEGSRHHNMKVLRPASAGRSEVRILFVFDPERRAVLLVAGDKAGNWTRWYRRNIPIADERYDEWLRGERA